jgi:hypothetical protein
MGGACGTDGEQQKCIQSFGFGDLTEGEHLKDLGTDRRIILK